MSEINDDDNDKETSTKKQNAKQTHKKHLNRQSTARTAYMLVLHNCHIAQHSAQINSDNLNFAHHRSNDV